MALPINYDSGNIFPPGFINATTSYFYQNPQVSGNPLLTNEVYVSPQGTDAPGNNGTVTNPFLTLFAALDYIGVVQAGGSPIPTNVYLAPGTYTADNLAVTDNVNLIGAVPSNGDSSVAAVDVLPTVIEGTLVLTASGSSTAAMSLSNLTIVGLVTINPVFYTTNVTINNCSISPLLDGSAITVTGTAFPANLVINNSRLSSSDIGAAPVIDVSNTQACVTTLTECQVSSSAESEPVIRVTSSLILNECIITNLAIGDGLLPLIEASAENANLDLNMSYCSASYADVSTVDAGGNKLVVKYISSALGNINSSLLNNNFAVFLGAAQTVILANTGVAGSVNLSQGANVCTLDGNSVNPANVVESTTVSFLNNKPFNGIVKTGQMDNTGFALDVPTSQYFRALTVPGVTTGATLVATTSGTDPVLSASAWITTVVPTTNTLTFWVAADPAGALGAWEAHYVITNF